jgi:hypothetical protein
VLRLAGDHVAGKACHEGFDELAVWKNLVYHLNWCLTPFTTIYTCFVSFCLRDYRVFGVCLIHPQGSGDWLPHPKQG